MSDWRIVLDRDAAKALRRLGRRDRERLAAAMAKLPQQGDIRELLGSAGLYRLRVGTWRVIFRVGAEDDLVQVVAIRPRGSAYKP